MIDWVAARAKDWGRQVRWLYCGKDGWPPRTALARLIEEGNHGAGVARYQQYFPECLSPEALITNNIIRRLELRHQEMFWIHDVIRSRVKRKIEVIGIEHRVYYNWLHAAHQAYSSAVAVNS